MGGGLESRCVGRVCGADGAVSRDHHPSKTSVQKTICCNSTSSAPDDGRMYLKHVELRIHLKNYLVASSWHFKLFQLVRHSSETYVTTYQTVRCYNAQDLSHLHFSTEIT